MYESDFEMAMMQRDEQRKKELEAELKNFDSFGERLTHLMCKKSITPTQLAQYLNIRYNTMCTYRANKRLSGKENFLAVVKYFNVDPEVLLPGWRYKYDMPRENKYSYLKYKIIIRQNLLKLMPEFPELKNIFSLRTLKHWYDGDRTPNDENLQKLADTFGVTIEYLLTDHTQEQEQAIEPVNKITPEHKKFLQQLNSLMLEHPVTGKVTTQKDLADFLKLHPEIVHTFIIGTAWPKFTTLIKIARYFNVSAGEILTGSRGANYKGEMPEKKVLADNLSTLVWENMISIQDLCGLLQCDEQIIQKYLDGRKWPSCKKIIALSDFFQVHVDDLLCSEPNFIKKFWQGFKRIFKTR